MKNRINSFGKLENIICSFFFEVKQTKSDK